MHTTGDPLGGSPRVVNPTLLEKCFEEALRLREPLNELRSLAPRLAHQGQDQTAIVANFEEARRQWRAANREWVRDVMMDVMDCLVGWCSPQVDIPPAADGSRADRLPSKARDKVATVDRHPGR
jgi:hypothetical protein